MENNHITINTDGGARGNPGPAAIGFIVKKNGQVIHVQGKKIGIATNNIAEYQAVISSLRWLKDHLSSLQTSKPIDFYLDSSLIVNQLNGRFKIKQAHLQQLSLEVNSLIPSIVSGVRFYHVPRYLNRQADSQVNQALDAAN